MRLYQGVRFDPLGHVNHTHSITPGQRSRTPASDLVSEGEAPASKIACMREIDSGKSMAKIARTCQAKKAGSLEKRMAGQR